MLEVRQLLEVKIAPREHHADRSDAGGELAEEYRRRCHRAAWLHQDLQSQQQEFDGRSDFFFGDQQDGFGQPAEKVISPVCWELIPSAMVSGRVMETR